MKLPFNVASDIAERSLKQLAIQSGMEVLFSTEIAGGVRTNSIKGDYSALEAAQRMLRGTVLEVSQKSDLGALVISRKNTSRTEKKDPGVVAVPNRNHPAHTSSNGDGSESPIELSPFTVNANQDVGYQASNTLAGSRLNTSLKDTSASISVMTAEFLSDLGAHSVEDAMAYAGNLQIDLEDTAAGITGNPVGENFTTYRVRGLKASVARNYFLWNIPGDIYNIERIDESRGPNSVLFGLGSAGGIINSTTKQAFFGWASGTVEFAASRFDSFRGTLDVNQPLIADKLAIRVNLLDGAESKSRWYSDSNDKRAHLNAQWRPFSGTTVRLEAERGAIEENIARGWTVEDRISLWDSRGRPLRATSTAATAEGIIRLNANAQRITWIENSNYFGDLRGSLITTVPAAQQDTMIVDRDLVDYSVNPAGPGAVRNTRFAAYTATVEQQLAQNTYVEVAFNHQRHDYVAYDPLNGDANVLYGDPNANLPATSSTTMANPNAGRYFVETRWYRRSQEEAFNTIRATLSNEFDLERWGHYRWAVMGEHEKSSFARDIRRETWADNPFGPAGVPEALANHVWRRYYVTEGQWDTYRVPTAKDNLITNRTDPVTGRTLSSSWVQFNRNIDDDTRDLKTLLLGGQAAYFDRRLIGTFGLRRDEVNLANRDTMRDPNTREWVVDYDTVEHSTDLARTRTYGAVWHLNPRFSLSYNQSSNNALPSNAHRVLPDSTRPDPSAGEGKDFGLGMDLLDGKVYARAGYFTTAGRRETDFRGVINIVTNRNERVLDALVGAGEISAAVADSLRVNTNAGYFDRESEGWEFRVVANPTPNWRIQANYTLTDAIESNIIPEVQGWANDAISFWSKYNTALVTSSSITIAQEIANLRNNLQEQISVDGAGAIGNRRAKFNVFTRYDFTRGAFRNFYIGGGYRHQSKMLIGRNNAGALQFNDPVDRVDLLLGYRFKFLERHKFRLQLNIENLLNDDDPVILRRTTDDLYVSRFVVSEPLTFRLSAKLDF